MLSMYVVKEQIPEGFEPLEDVLFGEWDGLNNWGTSGHWVHITPGDMRGFRDGFAVLTGMSPVWYDPMTIVQPHSHGEGEEVIWIAVEMARAKKLFGLLSMVMLKSFLESNLGIFPKVTRIWYRRMMQLLMRVSMSLKAL